MATASAQEPPEWDDDPAWTRPDPMTAAELEAGLDRVCEQDEGQLEDEADEYGDVEPFTAEELAEIRDAAADELLAVKAATTGRRGPGQPGSARVFPGQSSSPAAGFGPGMPLDVLLGCAGLAVAADAAAGEDGGFAGVSEAELVGVVCAWDRVEAHAAARKLAAVAELARRNPEPDDAEFTADQVAYALAESRGRAGDLVDLAQSLGTRLPGTLAALLDGMITRYKAEIIARATALLDDAEARAAESSIRNGRWISSPTGPSGGPHRPGGSTRPSPRGTPSSRRRDSQQRMVALRFPASRLWGGAVMSGPGDQTPAAEGLATEGLATEGLDHGGLRASHADRERVIGTLKAAFVQGRLTMDELDARVGRVYASRTYAELAAVTAEVSADIPADIRAELTAARSLRDPWRATKIAWRIEYAIFLPGIVAVLLLPGGPHTSVATVVILITVVYLIFWILGISLMFGSRPAKRPGRQLPPPSAPGIGE